MLLVFIAVVFQCVCVCVCGGGGGGCYVVVSS